MAERETLSQKGFLTEEAIDRWFEYMEQYAKSNGFRVISTNITARKLDSGRQVWDATVTIEDAEDA